MITIGFTYFRSLTLANLRASLYTVRQQDFSLVDQLIVLDNNTADSERAIQDVIDGYAFPVPVRLISVKHGDSTKTHAWSTNLLHRVAPSPWVFFTRADYLIAPNTLALFAAQVRHDRMFIVGKYYGLDVTIEGVEQYHWRSHGLTVLHPLGREYDHMLIDVGGVWLTSKTAFESVGGLDERLWAWGHQQTLFQYRLHEAGTEFVCVPQIVFYHAEHGYETPRDHALAIQQLASIGVDIHDLWARFDSPNNPYPVTPR